MVFYLKINRDVEYTLNNLRAWLESVACVPESKVYILCDNETLGEKVKAAILPDFIELDVSMIRSDRDTEELNSIAKGVTEPYWYKCACSHLSTFFHSKTNGYDSFWNIDADDTFFCVSRERLAEILTTVMRYADEKKLGLFSLDMWTSRNRGKVWSFGVTYTRNAIDWTDVMLSHIHDEAFSGFMPGHTRNLDLYFTYLRDSIEGLGIGTFCVDNLRFVHYGNDMYRNPIGSGFFHWKDGMLKSPLLFFFYGSRILGKCRISDDVKVFDMGITDSESYSLIGRYFSDYDSAAEVFFSDRAYDSEMNGLHRKRIVRSYPGMNASFVLFGCGNEGQETLEVLGESRVLCFVDNNRAGATIKGKPVISFNELLNMDFRNFTLLVTALRGFSEITKQLEDNGITNYHVLPFMEDDAR